MDVRVPQVPPEYDSYRERLRAFIAAHKPALEWKQRSGVRTPDRAFVARVAGKLIAQDLVKAVRNNLTIDWAVRENVRAGLRVIIKRILRKHGYPPDKQEKATLTVLEQAELLCRDWAA